MAREKAPPAPTGGIPMWFMTYSDVITLLMTFFILLLTFATDQPESFKKLKTSMYGGRGSFGFAASRVDAVDRTSLYLRLRPDHSRMTQRGTESQDMHSDPALGSMDKGLKSLDESSDLDKLDRMTFESSIDAFVTADGKLTNIGQQHLRLMAVQMKRMPVAVNFEVARKEDLDRVIELCDLMANGLKVPSGSVSASIVSGTAAPKHGLRITVVRTE